MTANTRNIARALGGDVAGRDRVLAPGPGHSPADRSLQVTLGGSEHFLVHSFAGDDWRRCRDHVRQRLGLPEWQPCDEQDRRISPQRVRQFDETALDREAAYRERTED